MSIQAKAFQFSLLIHGTLFAGLVLAGLLPTKQPPPLVIDFSLNLSEARAGEAAAAPGSDAPSPAGSTSPQPQAAEASPAISPPKPTQIAPQPKKAIPPKPNLHKKRPVASPEQVKEVAPSMPSPQAPAPSQASAVAGTSPVTGSTGVSPAPGAGLAQGKNWVGTASGTGGGNRGDGGGMGYDFSYVRERILKNLRFPATARQQGQTGKIVVSFTLLADGQVERIAIVTGSGHDILDQAVIDTIRRVAPFPKPPLSAQLVLPIVFHLK